MNDADAAIRLRNEMQRLANDVGRLEGIASNASKEVEKAAARMRALDLDPDAEDLEADLANAFVRLETEKAAIQSELADLKRKAGL